MEKNHSSAPNGQPDRMAIAELNIRIDALKARVNEKDDELRADIAALKDWNAELGGRLAALEAFASRQEGRDAAFEKRLATAEGGIVNVQRHVRRSIPFS